jgi:hypothetical protein
MTVLDISPDLLARHQALVKQPPVDKKRTCLKCGKVYRIKEGSRRGTCHSCGVSNDRMGMTASYHNVCQTISI